MSRRRRTATVALLVAVAAVAAAATLATGAATLSATPDAVDADPGDTVAVTLELTHEGDEATAYVLDGSFRGFTVENASGRYYRPDGHRWLLPTVEPGATQSVTFDLRVPDDAAGRYRLAVVAETADGVRARTTITVDTPGDRATATFSPTPTDTDDGGAESTATASVTESAATASATATESQPITASESPTASPTASPAASPTADGATTTATDGPGLGATVAALALVTVGWLARRG